MEMFRPPQSYNSPSAKNVRFGVKPNDDEELPFVNEESPVMKKNREDLLKEKRLDNLEMRISQITTEIERIMQESKSKSIQNAIGPGKEKRIEDLETQISQLRTEIEQIKQNEKDKRIEDLVMQLSRMRTELERIKHVRNQELIQNERERKQELERIAKERSQELRRIERERREELEQIEEERYQESIRFEQEKEQLRNQLHRAKQEAAYNRIYKNIQLDYDTFEDYRKSKTECNNAGIYREIPRIRRNPDLYGERTLRRRILEMSEPIINVLEFLIIFIIVSLLVYWISRCLD